MMNEINAELMMECFAMAWQILDKYSQRVAKPTSSEIRQVALVLFADAIQPESVELIEIVEVKEKREAKLEGGSYMGFKHGPCDEPPADDIASERWFAGQDDLTGTNIHDSEGNHVATVWIDGGFAKVVAAAPEMRDALKIVTVKSRFSRITVGGCIVDRISVEFNPDQWRIITNVLNKADGGE